MSEAIYTCRPRVVRALQWTGDNYHAVENFVGAARCAAWNVERCVIYLYTADGLARVLRSDWLYFDERRELHATSDLRFNEDFVASGA
jgi:hypothetical protein